MASCRVSFLDNLYSVMTRQPCIRCVVASGPGQRPTGSGCAIRFPDLGNRRQVTRLPFPHGNPHFLRIHVSAVVVADNSLFRLRN
jgi:hypothetical protein